MKTKLLVIRPRSWKEEKLKSKTAKTNLVKRKKGLSNGRLNASRKVSREWVSGSIRMLLRQVLPSLAYWNRLKFLISTIVAKEIRRAFKSLVVILDSSSLSSTLCLLSSHRLLRGQAHKELMVHQSRALAHKTQRSLLIMAIRRLAMNQLNPLLKKKHIPVCYQTLSNSSFTTTLMNGWNVSNSMYKCLSLFSIYSRL